MLRAKRRLLGGVTGLLVVGGLLVAGKRPADLTAADARRIRPGMTAAEVDRRLGGPPRNALTRRGAVWEPQADGSLVSRFVDRGDPAISCFPKAPGDGRQAAWITPSGLIAVEIGPAGRVRDVYFSPVQLATGPSAVHWLASRPRAIRRWFGF